MRACWTIVPLALSAVLGGSLGCTAEMAEGGYRQPDAGKADDPIDTKPSLRVDSPGVTTYWMSVPLTGEGPSTGTLIVTSADGSSIPTTLSTDGGFCIDVPLMKGVVNEIVVEAISSDGHYSDPVTVSIRQEGEPPDPEPTDPEYAYANIAASASEFHGSVNVESGSFAMLGDGDLSQHVKLGNDWNGGDWMTMKLTKKADVEEMRFVSTSTCQMKDYKVFLSDDDSDPGIPMNNSAWVMSVEVKGGAVDHTVSPLFGSSLARWIGIEFMGRDCGPLIGAAKHELREIEVWASVELDGGGGGNGGGEPSCSNGF